MRPRQAPLDIKILAAFLTAFLGIFFENKVEPNALAADDQSAPCLHAALLQATHDTPSIHRSPEIIHGDVMRKYTLSGDRGSLLAQVLPDGKTLYIFLITIPPEHKGKGYSNLLFEAAVRDAGPDIEAIEGSLMLENFAAFEKAYNKTPVELRRKNPQAAIAIGVQNTPFYKSAKKQGFTVIRQALLPKKSGRSPIDEAMARAVDVTLERAR